MIGYNGNFENYTKPLSLKDGISQQRAKGVFDRITVAGTALLNTTDALSVSRWMLSINDEFESILDSSSSEYLNLIKDILQVIQQQNSNPISCYLPSSNTVSTTSCNQSINRILDIITDVRSKLILPDKPVIETKTITVLETTKDDKSKPSSSRKIFIVHGHDDAMKLEVARFVEQLGLKAIILHEQVNKGRTVIEKFEANSDVDYAIVLMSPDDVGNKKDSKDDLKPRARQNVIFELGFFMGKLGRERVCALLKDNVEQPSDITGVLYIPFTSHWKFDVAKEIKASGVDIDMNNIV